MDQIPTNNKVVTITYNSLDDLLVREEAMKRTLINNLERENGGYEYVDSYISMKGTKYVLNLEIALIEN